MVKYTFPTTAHNRYPAQIHYPLTFIKSEESLLYSLLCAIFTHRYDLYSEYINFNNNRERHLTKGFVDGIYSYSCDGLYHFKQPLARYDHLLNGTNQKNVNDSFAFLIELLHLGTQENLLNDFSLESKWRRSVC